MKFVKMHGLGNDFIFLRDPEEKVGLTPGEIQKLCHRNFGIGADGLVLVLPSRSADCRMRIFNHDGSEAEMCGNALRCLARYVYERGPGDRDTLKVETREDIKGVKLFLSDKGEVGSIEIDMGAPVLESRLVPAAGPDRRVLREKLEVEGFPGPLEITAVSMGNPHCVIFVENVAEVDLATLGPRVENHPLFPRRVNLEVVEVVNPGEVNMRVWERGVGETLACGTGACAGGVAGVLNGLTRRKVAVNLPGGRLEVNWQEETGRVFLKGPAEEVFTGEISKNSILAEKEV